MDAKTDTNAITPEIVAEHGLTADEINPVVQG